MDAMQIKKDGKLKKVEMQYVKMKVKNMKNLKKTMDEN